MNGYNESCNGKLRDELLDREIFYALKEALVDWAEHRGVELEFIQPGKTHAELIYRKVRLAFGDKHPLFYGFDLSFLR